ncbi:hypothetical protein L6164_034664 [Bauhinia variegata]|uniref:Uncharacterized protein n=1 Tax=Bauhinia variegata TaxID=167791 RepID=A0ACB9KW60_BAUVA|nr:hypothetical protein L6164_034664 [Bauhinia variegata]
MKQLSGVTSIFSNKILKLLSDCTSPNQLRQIQAQLVLQNLYSDTTIAYHFINACQSFGLLNTAFMLCTLLPRPRVFICNSLIRGLSHSRIPHMPLAIYTHMHKNSILPNKYTFPFLFKSLSDSLNSRHSVYSYPCCKIGSS